MEITTVPLQPNPKGMMSKLWFGVAACVAIAGGLAWAGTRDQATGGSCGSNAFVRGNGALAPIMTASGLRFQTVKAGEGDKPTDADVTLVGYKGTLTNGKQFDANPRMPLPVAQVVPGFSEALKMMQRGGSYRICIPSKLGYGDHVPPGGPIPANATLLFTVELLDFKSMAEVQAQMQQMRAQQMKNGGAAGQPGNPHPEGMPQ
jgi:hypothetical protein